MGMATGPRATRERPTTMMTKMFQPSDMKGLPAEPKPGSRGEIGERRLALRLQREVWAGEPGFELYAHPQVAAR